MKNHVFFFVVSLMFIHAQNRKLFQLGNTEHTMRITNMTNCHTVPTNMVLTDLKLAHSGYRPYINGKFHITEDFCAKLLNIKINRCLNHGYACEYFQTWNITDVCLFNRMKSSMWRPFHDAIKPSTWSKDCPCFKKGILTITNGTVDLKEIITFYSEAAKYHWQLQSVIYDRKNVEQQCLYMTFYLTSYNAKIPVST